MVKCNLENLWGFVGRKHTLLSFVIYSYLYNMQHRQDDNAIHGNDGESVIREEFSKKGNIHGLCGQNPVHLVSGFWTHLKSSHCILSFKI